MQILFSQTKGPTSRLSYNDPPNVSQKSHKQDVKETAFTYSLPPAIGIQKHTVLEGGGGYIKPLRHATILIDLCYAPGIHVPAY